MRIVTKPIRRLIALTAAYAVALQAALAGVALLAAASAGHAAPQICAAAGHDPQSDSVPMGSDCTACPAVCSGGGPDAVASGGFTVAAPAAAAFAVERRDARVAPGRGQRLLPPSRAPPAT